MVGLSAVSVESSPAADTRWAFSPPQAAAVPPVKDAGGTPTPVDGFVAAKLAGRGLRMAQAADRRTLIRRATFDLTGLPPTPREVAAFLADAEPNAFHRVLDRLLASPRYGECWARHWLDVVRYTDSFDARILTGEGSVMDCTEAWRYRDWVVAALNDDMPYDEFVRRQVAGDLSGDVIATGAFAIGNWGGGDADKEKLLTDIADDQVDLTSRAFLGVTLGCARCHDHKFDPFSQRDYYALAGIFFSSHILANPGPKTNGPPMLRIPLASAQEIAARETAQKRAREIDDALGRQVRPLTNFQRDFAGKTGLFAWTLAGRDNPSCVINSTGADVAFGTVKLPAAAVCVHPGPSSDVSISWRAPADGSVEVSAQIADADPNCGNGIGWSLRHGDARLAEGVNENGAAADLPARSFLVKSGDLVRLVILPRGEYSCDSTRVEIVVRGGRETWRLTQFLVAQPEAINKDVWWVCAGAGASIGGSTPEETKLESERARLTALLARPLPMCNGLQEGGCPDSPQAGVHNVRLHKRGRYDALGEEVERGFPVVLTHSPATRISEGSGRRELARWLTSSENPLTARVIVNRVWMHHFGEGLVRTPNNFGALGEPPTHPELLDWLAVEFIKSGWSLKGLHRLIMSSAAWQQSSVAPVATLTADAENRLLGRQNRRRLESEAIRDALLDAAGKLDFTAGGPAVREFDNPRRTLYLMTIRSDRANYQSLFDAADPTGIAEKRVASTVAPQALFLLNHPFALAQAKALADRSTREAPAGIAHRVEWLYQRLFARPPSPEETALALTAVGNGTEWESYCHTLLCANEFVYVD
jgi:hypothetical protein